MRSGREAILSAAIRVFAEQGYAGASTRAICQAAGITKPVLYYHFCGKEHLFTELLIDCFGHYRKLLLRASQVQGSVEERLANILWTDYQDARKNPQRVRFMLRMFFSPEEKHPHFDFIRELESQRKLITSVFREAIQDGYLKGSPKELATAMMSLELYAILEYLYTGRPTLTRARAEASVNLLLIGAMNRKVYRSV